MKKLYSPFCLRTAFVLLFMLTFVRGWGQGTLIITRSNFPTGTGYTTSTWSSTTSTSENINGTSRLFLTNTGNIQIGGTETPHPYNSTVMPGAITKIEITMPGAGTVRTWTPRVSASTSITTATGGTALASQTFATNTGTLTWNLNATDNYKYFYLQAGGNTNISQIKITYETAPACTPPTPSWVTAPSTFSCAGVDELYETQSGKSNYVWAIPGVAGTDYTIVSGGNSTSNTLAIKWLTGGSKTVTVGYTDSGCASTTPASYTSTVSSVAISPTTTQNIFAGDLGNQLTANEVGATATSREWKYSTTVGGPYVSFSPARTATTYTPQFATPNTYYVICESIFACGAVKSNAVQISVTALPKPVITSSATKTGTYGTTSSSYQITASNSPTSYAITSPTTLPAGFTYDAATRNLSAADNTVAGVYTFTLTATNASGTSDPLTLTWTINKKTVTLSGITVNKIYDQTTTATLDVSAATINTLLASDALLVGISNTGYTATYNNKNVGTGKAITLSGLSLTGSRASNYTLTQPTLTGTISKRDITVSGITADNKVYDGTTSATFDTSAIVANTIYSGDNVTYAVTGAFADANAGTGKTVNLSAVTLGGTDGGNYNVTPLPTGLTANITRATPVILPASILLGLGETRNLTTLVTSTNTSSSLVFSVAVGNGIVDLPTSTTIHAVGLGNTMLTVTQAADTNYEAVNVTIPVTVEADSAIVGDYKTIANGDWNTLSIWQVKNSSGWVAATSVPISANTSDVFSSTIFINNNITLSLTNIRNFKFITINAGGQLSKSGSQPMIIADADGKLLIKDKGFVTATTLIRFASNATFEIEDGGTYTHNQGTGAQLTVNVFSGREKFHPNSNFIVNTVPDVNSTNLKALISDFTSLSPFDAGNFNSGYFGNIIFETATISVSLVLGEGTTQTIAGATDYAIAAGDIIYRSGSATSTLIAVSNTQETTTVSSASKPYKIGGNLKIESGYTGLVRVRNNTAATYFKIGKNLEIEGTTIFSMLTLSAGNNDVSLYVDGNIIVKGTGKFFPYSNSSGNTTATVRVFLKGDIQVASTAFFANDNPSASNATLNFVNIGDGSIDALTQDISIGSAVTAQKINFVVNSGSYTRLLNQNLTLGTNSKFNVLSGGTLDFGFAGTTALNILGNGTTGTGFSAAAGSYLKITSPAGISSTSGTVGNIQTNTAPVFTQPLTYHYIGNADQIMGTAVGTTSSGKAIIVDLATKDLTLTPSTSFGITNAVNTNVNSGNGGILDIRKGRLVETDALYINGGSSAANGGALKMLPDTYYKITRPSGAGDSEYIPRFYNTSITGGEIELASSTGGQTLRGGRTYYDLTFSNGGTKEISNGTEEINGLISVMANTILDGKTFTVGKTATELLMDSGSRFKTGGNGTKPDAGGTYVLDPTSTIEFQGTSATEIRVSQPYENVDVSGTNVIAGGKNFIVNNLLKVTDATAVLTVPEVFLESETPFVVTAKKGIQIVNGGKAIFKNNANLLQDIDATNVGNITMERKATVPSTQYNYWASPVENQSLYGLYAVPANSVKTYNSTSDLFNTLPSGSTSVFGKGYSIKGPTTATVASPTITATFVGKPNNESTAGVNTITLSTEGRNFNLIGNPYPSNLDLVELYNANVDQFYNEGGTTPTVFLWDNTGNTELTQLGTSYSGYAINNYATVNLPSGLGAPATRNATTGKIPNGIVRPGQGFIMRASETATNLVFKNNQRTSAILKGGKNSQYFKGAATASNDNFWLRLTTSRNMNIVIALSYHPEATNSFERFDSSVLNEAVTENFYSLSSDFKKLAIQSRKGDFNTEDVIPLAIKISENGIQKISIEDKTGVFSESQNIYLRDKALNKVVNLSTGDYTFSANKGTDDTRFEIVYKDNLVLGTDVLKKSDFVVYKDGLGYVINSTKSLGKIEVYDAAGRLVLSQKTTNKNIKLDATILANGLYIIKTENSGDVKTNKILK